MKLDKIFQFFVPKETKFQHLFREASENLVKTAELLNQMVNEPDSEKRNKFVKTIKDAERAGDQITKRLYQALNSTYITPFDREDIYDLVSKTDSIVDLIYTSAKRMALYDLREVPMEFKEIARLIVLASNEIHYIFEGLKDAHTLAKYSKSLHVISDIEGKSDDINHQYLAKLFKEESNGVELIKRKDILNSLEKAIDRCDDVADIINTILVKYA
ncbi:MAG TPA: DUF47 family protein [Bacteroidales bacterium]|jgi:predicted phosphate transport protein (TIGR00153 family)|nr:DUF47 family protein [Bacteroidales bacterium]